LLAWPCVDDRGEVAGKVIGVALIGKRKGKWELERDLGFANDFAVAPGLTVKRYFRMSCNRVKERFAIARKVKLKGHNAG